MLLLKPEDLKEIIDQAEAAYPREACGLLAGFERPDGDIEVTRVAPSKNMAEPAQHDRFEVDPRVRLDVMRALENTPESIIGHYHSHPDHPAEPSAHDLEMAFEPDLVWVIAAVEGARATEVRAHVVAASGDRFLELEMRSGDQPADHPGNQPGDHHL